MRQSPNTRSASAAATATAAGPGAGSATAGNAMNPLSREAQLASYIRPVYGLCLRLLRDAHLAEDALQESFVDAVAMWDRFEAAPDESGAGRDPRLRWILAIAAHRAFRLRSGRGREQTGMETTMERLESPAAPAGHAPEDEAARRETLAQLEAALDELPEPEREAVLLHHIHGLSQVEIARALEAHPRTISRRIQDGIAELRRRLSDRGVPETLALAPLFLRLPAPPPPAGLAAQVLSHPTILAWTSSTSAAATASTAATGASASVPGSLTNTATITKGATIMSSKLILAAPAAVCAAAVLAWMNGFLAPAAPPVSRAPLAAPQLAANAPGANPNAAVAPRPQPMTNGDGGGAGAPSAADATPPAPKPTPEELEKAFDAKLTAAQQARRAALRQALASSLPNDNHPTNGWHSAVSDQVTSATTEVGSFLMERLDRNRVVGYGLALQAAAAVPGPFVCPDFKVQNMSMVESNSDLVSSSKAETDVTTTGVTPSVDLTGEKPKFGVAEPASVVVRSDVFPAGLPADYDAQRVLDGMNLGLTATPALTKAFAAAQTADGAFLDAADRFAKAPKDAKVGAAMWTAGQTLIGDQDAVAKLIDGYLRNMQSGPQAWSMLKVSAGEHQQAGMGQILSDLAGAIMGGDKETHITVGPATTGGGAGGSGTKVQTGSGNASVASQAAIGAGLPPGSLPASASTGSSVVHYGKEVVLVPVGKGGPGKVAAAMDEPKIDAKTPRTYTFESKDETLGHLAQVISQNPLATGTVTVDPAIAGNQVEGKCTGKTLEELAQNLAKLAKVDCQADGKTGWKLTPKPDTTAGAGNEGF
ncbi:MAG: RNA polymerase sigma factor [Planctomycetota bacterium]